MQLNEDQKEQVRQWAAAGCTLAELQRLINETFNISATFMDVRFLVLDMGIDIQDRQHAATTTDLSKAPAAQEPDATDQMPGGGVAVSMDRVVKPGAIVSGNVTFSDGVQAEWMLDQMGRLALSAGTPGYRPSQEDLQSFQTELTALLQRQGMG